jgi:DNA-binding transcriptional ArsR family regulator
LPIDRGRALGGDLAGFLGLRDSTVSQHLSPLRRDGLVRARRDGQTIWYSIARTPARQVLQTLFEIFCRPAAMCEPPLSRRKSPATPRPRRS